jgi:hypothetical protein
VSAALQQVIETIDQEIAKLQAARAVVAGLVLPASQPVHAGTAGAVNVVVSPGFDLAAAGEAFKESIQKAAQTRTVWPEDREVDEPNEERAPRPRKPSVIRAPAMPTLKGWKKVELTPEQIATIRAGAKAERAISQIARETGLSDYIVKTRIATMQMEGQL